MNQSQAEENLGNDLKTQIYFMVLHKNMFEQRKTTKEGSLCATGLAPVILECQAIPGQKYT